MSRSDETKRWSKSDAPYGTRVVIHRLSSSDLSREILAVDRFIYSIRFLHLRTFRLVLLDWRLIFDVDSVKGSRSTGRAAFHK